MLLQCACLHWTKYTYLWSSGSRVAKARPASVTLWLNKEKDLSEFKVELQTLAMLVRPEPFSSPPWGETPPGAITSVLAPETMGMAVQRAWGPGAMTCPGATLNLCRVRDAIRAALVGARPKSLSTGRLRIKPSCF